MIPEQINSAVLDFCSRLDPEEAKRLAFRKTIFEGISNAWLAEQADLRRLAAAKLPEWTAFGNLVFPDKQALEQCTSSLAANWKKSLLPPGIRILADASAGLGVDAFALADLADKSILFEPDANRAAALRYNAPSLLSAEAEVREHPLSEIELKELADAGSGFLLYADPDRRREDGKRKVHWTECSPDVRIFHRILKDTKSRLLVKFSPMDEPEEIAQALPGVSAVYLVSVHNEVKEVLMLWDFSSPGEARYQAVDLRRSGELQNISIPVQLEGRPIIGEARAGHFLLDPLAALRKGRFAACLAEEQGWKQLSARARLYVSESRPAGFPGRVFEILGTYVSASAFRSVFAGNSCHLVCRDFVVSAEELRKSLKLREEGEDFLFCFSDEAGQRRIVHTRRC
jgi:hypothetical protein